MSLDPLADCEGFDWDDGNIGKVWTKHRVSDGECEEIFFNQPLVVASDAEHSSDEPRFYALGQSNRARFLFVGFTVRNRLLRPITARDMTRRERRIYENAKKDSEVQG